MIQCYEPKWPYLTASRPPSNPGHPGHPGHPGRPEYKYNFFYRIYRNLFMSKPVLMEVPASPTNIAYPTEDQLQHWVAVDGGGFERRTTNGTVGVVRQLARATLPVHKSHVSIRKRVAKPKKPVEYFVDHCENTTCSFPFGHAGLCSHQIVHGKRGCRPTRVYAINTNQPSPFHFDLNDSDSE